VQGELADFTPFGYLRNPSHRARSWGDTTGGNLRAAPDYVGVEWVYPVGRDATSRAGIGLETSADGRACRTRAEFQAIGMTSRYHTSAMIGFDWRNDGLQVEARFFLVDDDALCIRLEVRNAATDTRHVSVRLVEHHEGEPPGQRAVVGPDGLDRELDPDETLLSHTVYSRGRPTPEADQAEAAFHSILADDLRFASTCPTLSGDWPAHWREGLHHDFQTTRLLLQPPGGIFRDIWPAWMVAWPRVVLAEGTLDMLRLGYVEPGTAQRAVLSLFRDAPEPNVPCVFAGGEYNMVAADGSRCGTSPAWCLPFLNLELLYLRTLDREWLAQLVPRLAAYLEWWLAQRTDPDGWLVYKCTWESGEDGNPRLDRSGSGDADISDRVRPVELQATMAHAAGVMSFFASELSESPDRWDALAKDFRERTRRMFDPRAGRYRDWLIDEQRLQEPCSDQPYWGVDACRYSAQSLTPLLVGETLPDEEIWCHASPPWTLWPSWTYSLIESAAAAGHYARVGEVVFEIIDRVYRVTTRRDIASLARPMPGSSPEFWPEDWRTYGGSDAYGWGATTANLLIRHLFGFKESRLTDGWVAELTPALPMSLRSSGSRYVVRRLSYRGITVALSYVVTGDRLLIELDLGDSPRALTVEHVTSGDTETAPRSATHRVWAHFGERLRLRLA
jgi:hypothetical protein